MARDAFLIATERLYRAGQRALLQDLLEVRFGALPEEALTRLDRAEAGAITRWSRRLLTAHSLDEVFAGAPGSAAGAHAPHPRSWP